MSEPRIDDAPVIVRWAADEFGAGVIAASLEGDGISARVVTEDPDGTTGFFGATSQRRVGVLVSRADVERAEAVLARAREEGREGIDWDRVDVGEPEDELARRISLGERGGRGAPGRRTWWWGGWPASIVLLIAGFIALAFSAPAAIVIWLGALIACVGSSFSWIGSRLGRPREDDSGGG